MIRLVVIDDHAAVREAIAVTLADDPDVEIVGCYASIDESLRDLTRLAPTVVLVDDRLPGGDGVEACRAIQRRMGQVRIVVLATFPGKSVAREALEAGANGVVLKGATGTSLHEAVRTVSSGRTYLDPHLAGGVGASTVGHTP